METCRIVSFIESFCDSAFPSFEQVYPDLPRQAECNIRARPSGSPTPANAVVDGLQVYSGGPRQHKLPEEQNVPPPSFEVPTPAQAPPMFPNIPDWQDFEGALQSQFDEFSHVDVPEEGPVLHVVTWYVHHDRLPSCIVGRLVRLSNRPSEWPQLLCTPWLPLLQPAANLAFHIARPHPTPDLPGQQIIHVILEQGIQVGRHTALISALFHGLHGDVTHRRAQSIPTHLSREVIERLLEIVDLCRQRRCAAWSGRIQFHRSRLEPVFQGIGISLTVAPFRNRFAHVDDDGFPIHDTASSSQIPPRMSFREDDASLFPHAAAVPVGEDIVLEHQPSRLIPALRVIWEQYLMSTTQRPYRFYIETWFCDHARFPRTDRSREIQLPPDQNSWRDAIIAKWQDLIDPSAEVLIYVVDPQPIGGPPEVLAHVILAQHQHTGFVSALITTLAPGDDPWDPPRVALKLPAIVDKALLIQESGLFTFCPPFLPFNAYRAHLGAQEIHQDRLHDAQSGDGFICIAEAVPMPASERVSQPPQAQHIHHLFGSLASLMTGLVAALDRAVDATDGWLRNLVQLDTELQCIETDVRSFLSAMPCTGRPAAPGLLRSPSLEAAPSGLQLKTPLQEPQRIAGPDSFLRNVPKVVTSLMELQQAKSRAGTTGAAALHVRVWFSDHLRYPIPMMAPLVCLEPTWQGDIVPLLCPWSAVIDFTADLFLYVVHPRGLPCESSTDAQILLLQHPVANLSTVLLAIFPDSAGSQPPEFTLALVAEPITSESLHQAVSALPSGLFADSSWEFDFTWGLSPVASVDSYDVHHGECFAVWPRLVPEPWIGLSDAAFSVLIQKVVPTEPVFPLQMLVPRLSAFLCKHRYLCARSTLLRKTLMTPCLP